MNVLIIAQYFPPDIGGASTRVYNVAKGLVELGNTVKVITAFPHYPHGRTSFRYKKKALMFEEMDRIKIIRVWVPSLPSNSVINRIILHLCYVFSSQFALPFEGKVDIIFAANPNFFSFFSALIYSFIKRRPIVRNVDDLWPEVFYDMNLVKLNIFKKLLDLMAWLSYSVPVAITPISPGYKRRIIEKYGVREKKISVVEVGIDTFFHSKPKNLKKEDFIVMYSGVFGPAYDFKTLLMAAKYLSDQKDIRFIIRGFGECEQEIREMITNLKLGNVSLDTTVLSKLKMLDVLHLADVFLLPMKELEAAEDGLPTKLFEYQSLGKPIICSSNGESAKYVLKTKSGIVVNPHNYMALAEAIRYLYNNRDVACQLGDNGQKYVKKNLTSTIIGERMHKIFSSIICKNVVNICI